MEKLEPMGEGLLASIQKLTTRIVICTIDGLPLSCLESRYNAYKNGEISAEDLKIEYLTKVQEASPELFKLLFSDYYKKFFK